MCNIEANFLIHNYFKQILFLLDTMKISILGGGSWGTALAIHLAKKDHQVKIWEFFEEQAKEMQESRECKLLPGTKLAENIFVSSEMQEVIPDSELVLVVVPSDKVEVTMENAKEFLENKPIVICSKGFAEGLRFLSEAVNDKIDGDVYCLYGPSHAEEVCKGMFTGVVLAGKESEERQKIQEALSSADLKVDVSNDVIGVQVCSALKNVLAVFVGVLDGKGLGDNAKSFVITKGLAEIKSIGLKLGAYENTFDGLAGLGDVIATCTSKHSRNRYLGQEVGKGRKLDDVINEMKMVAEGVTAVKKAVGFKEKLGLELPLVQGLHDVLFDGKNVEEVLEKL